MNIVKPISTSLVRKPIRNPIRGNGAPPPLTGLVGHYLEAGIVGQPVTSWTNEVTPLGNLDVLQGTAANLRRVPDGTVGFFGASGDYLTLSSDTISTSQPGPIDVRIIDVNLDDWTSAAMQVFMSKFESTGNQKSFIFRSDNGNLVASISSNGIATLGPFVSTVGHGFSDGTTQSVRWTFEPAGSGTHTFYTSINSGSTWLQLGATVSGGGPGALFNSNSPIEVGSAESGTSGNITGSIGKAEMLDAVDGNTVVLMDPTVYLYTDDITFFNNFLPEEVTTNNAVKPLSEGPDTASTAGWGNFGLTTGGNQFISQSGVTDGSNNAFLTNANPNPTADARIFVDVHTALGLVDGNVYRISFSLRHSGTGLDWKAVFSSSGSLTTNQTVVQNVTNSETTFVTYSFVYTNGANFHIFGFIENNASNNGGVYVDNLSIQLASDWKIVGKSYINNTGFDIVQSGGSVGIETTAATIVPTPMTIFIVARFTEAIPAADQYLFDSFAAVGNEVNLFTDFSNSNAFTFNAGGVNIVVPGSYDVDLHLFTIQYNGDGTTKITVSNIGDVTADAGSKSFGFGALYMNSANANQSDIFISEYKIYAEARTAPEIATEQSTLEAKYGIL